MEYYIAVKIVKGEDTVPLSTLKYITFYFLFLALFDKNCMYFIMKNFINYNMGLPTTVLDNLK